MSVNTKNLAGRVMSLLLVVTSVAPLSGDRRLVDAMKNREWETVRVLLQQKADVNAPQGDGATALHWAAHWDDVGMASVLIRAGAKLNAANDFGITPLALACTNGSAAMVETLLNAGANPKAARPTGETVLMTCARTGNADAVKALLVRGADVGAAETTQGQSALMWAAAQNHAAVIRTLIEAGADVHARTKFAASPREKSRGVGYTPVLFAARAGAREALEVLLAHGANVNDAAADGASPLHVALSQGHWDLASFLLERGANPNADGVGYTPLHWAAGSWSTSHSVSELEKYQWMAARGPGKLELVKVLLAHGADPNARLKRVPGGGRGLAGGAGRGLDGAGATPFVLAARAGDVNVMRALLAAGADPHLTADDGTTALMAAAGLGQTWISQTPQSDAFEATKFALDLGVDINAVTEGDQETALHGAAYFKADQVVQLLVEKGAHVNPRNRLGLTPMTIAQGYGGGSGVFISQSTVKLLRSLGGVGDVDMPPAPIAEVRTPCPRPTIFFHLQNPGYGPVFATTTPTTRYSNGTCADLKVGTSVRVKGIRETEKNWDGSVLASEIEIAR